MRFWLYRQTTGELLHATAARLLAIATGYSGHGAGKNNPAAAAEKNVGPICCGWWTVGAPAYVGAPGPHGPFVLPLTPDPTTETHGRSGFLCHGDSFEHPGDASEGCLIQARIIREQIAASGDARLLVIP